jgi:hypothetical protein
MDKQEKCTENRFCKEFVEIVQLIIDGEATDADRIKFNDYYMQCNHCLEYYSIESSTLQFIRQTFQSEALTRQAPSDLVGNIRNTVSTSA